MSKKIPGSASRPVRIAPPSETCIALIAAVLLASCGGGGSGGGTPPPPPPTVTGNVFAPTTGPGDTENYFPSSTGNKWFMTYASTETGAAGISGISTTSVTGTRTVLGVSAKVLLQEDSTGNTGSIENYYAISAGGITFVGDNDAEDDITPQLVPWAQLLFPVNLGTVSSLSASNLPLGTDASGNPITVNLTQRIDNVSFEPLNVPAGTFRGSKETLSMRCVRFTVIGLPDASVPSGRFDALSEETVPRFTGNRSWAHGTSCGVMSSSASLSPTKVMPPALMA